MSDFRQKLEDFGVPADAVQGLITEQLAGLAAVSQSPAGKWLQQHEHELQPYLNQRPEVMESFGRLAQVDAVAAVDYVRLRMTEDMGQRPASGSKTTMLPVRSGYDLPASPWHSPAVGYGQRETPEAARERYRQTGSRRDAEAYAHARLGQVITDEFLNQ